MVYIGNYGFLIVLSESMQPYIEKNELIIIEKKCEYQLNDVVTYINSENIPVTHRIVEIDKNSFVAKGDNNKISDESMPIEKIYGKVVYKSKFVGIFIMYYLKCIILGFFCVMLFIYVKRIIFKGEYDE